MLHTNAPTFAIDPQNNYERLPLDQVIAAIVEEAASEVSLAGEDSADLRLLDVEQAKKLLHLYSEVDKSSSGIGHQIDFMANITIQLFQKLVYASFLIKRDFYGAEVIPDNTNFFPIDFYFFDSLLGNTIAQLRGSHVDGYQMIHDKRVFMNLLSASDVFEFGHYSLQSDGAWESRFLAILGLLEESNLIDSEAANHLKHWNSIALSSINKDLLRVNLHRFLVKGCDLGYLFLHEKARQDFARTMKETKHFMIKLHPQSEATSLRSFLMNGYRIFLDDIRGIDKENLSNDLRQLSLVYPALEGFYKEFLKSSPEAQKVFAEALAYKDKFGLNWEQIQNFLTDQFDKERYYLQVRRNDQHLNPSKAEFLSRLSIRLAKYLREEKVVAIHSSHIMNAIHLARAGDSLFFNSVTSKEERGRFSKAIMSWVANEFGV